MSGKEQFIKIPREVLESDAFGSLGINGIRVVRGAAVAEAAKHIGGNVAVVEV